MVDAHDSMAGGSGLAAALALPGARLKASATCHASGHAFLARWLRCCLLTAAYLGSPLSAAQVSFTDITVSAGLNTTHQGVVNAVGQAWIDLDADGHSDLFVTDQQGPNSLYRNLGDGRFSLLPDSITSLAGETTLGASSADVDNDGRDDLLVLTLGQPRLFRNTAAGLVDITATSGINHAGQGQSATWADINADGWLDLYITNWYFNEDETHPNNQDRLYLNQGGGRFADVSHWLDLTARSGPGFACLFFDYDNDGDSDLYVVNDKHYGNPLWRNDGPGCDGWCWTNVAVNTGANRPVFGMGVSAGDFDLDGDLDIYFTSIDEMVLLRNDVATSGVFTEVTDDYGVNVIAVGWGSVFADVDNDGREDLYVPTAPSGFGNSLLLNRYPQAFDDISAASGINDDAFSISASIADFEADGRLDVLLGNRNQGYRVYANHSPDAGHWVQFTLAAGAGVNSKAVGTRLYLTLDDGQELMREVMIGGSMGVSHQALIHFGLGQRDIQQLRVVWPDGAVQFPSVTRNQRHVLRHPQWQVAVSEGFE